MKIFNRLLIGVSAVAAVALGPLASRADDAEYNLQRAMEALANENYDEAMKYAGAVIADAPGCWCRACAAAPTTPAMP